MLAVILTGSFHPVRALAQCGGGDYQGMHQQHMGSSGQMGMGTGQMGMSGQMGMGSGQMGMGNAQVPPQADPNATAPAIGPGVWRPAGNQRLRADDRDGPQRPPTLTDAKKRQGGSGAPCMIKRSKPLLATAALK